MAKSESESIELPDFSTLVKSVVSLANFLVSHTVWLGFTIVSIVAGTGSALANEIERLGQEAIHSLADPRVSALLEGYGLKPLVPALAILLIIFALHANRMLLQSVGRFIPPDIMLEYMCGVRDILPGRWNFVIRRLNREYSIRDLVEILEVRYSNSDLRKYGEVSYHSYFNCFKSLTALNLVLLLAFPHRTAGVHNSFLLALLFAASTVLAGWLIVYHERTRSYWAVEEILRKLIGERVESHHGKDHPDVELSDNAVEEVEIFVANLNRRRIWSLGWHLPLLGSVAVFREFVRKNLDKTRMPERHRGKSKRRPN